MNLISYTFFEPKQIFSHRNGWDKHNKLDRYWYNIPAVICVNKILYPDFKIKLHISPNIYPLLEILENDFGVLIETIDVDYKATEPTVWRYKPLLEKECDILLCRDIDSLPTLDEVLSTYYFINHEDFKIGTMRSHTAHRGKPTIMMAGLCSFKVNDIDVGINFDQLLERVSNSGWGVDQNFLIDTLTSDKEWVKKHFVDARLSNSEHRVCEPAIECISFDYNFYRKNVKLDIESHIFPLLNDYTTWAGEPVDVRGKKLMGLLELDYDVCKQMKELINNNEYLKEFYL